MNVKTGIHCLYEWYQKKLKSSRISVIREYNDNDGNSYLDF